jgi:solute carrier family 25 S-adenosylmethionine transporter 26
MREHRRRGSARRPNPRCTRTPTHRRPSSLRSPPKLHHLAVDAICGAVGEVAGLVALYPLDTLKVQCQARGCSAGTALTRTLALGPTAALRTLYAGMGGAAAGAAAIGSLYLLTFYAAKRAGASLARVAAAPSSSSEDTASSSTPIVASVAGAAASVVGSLIEAPIEAFKVRAQAGADIGGGGMLSGMVRMAAVHGLAPLYASFVPYLLKSIPHDVTELCTFSQISEGLAVRPAPALAALPPEARDMAVGAVSGAAAAIASMPFDVIFTRMNLAGGGVSGGGVGGSLAAFGATARAIVAQGGGPGALFAGVVPRLLQTVPAAMIYWAAVEATRRHLETNFEVERPAGVDGQMPATVHGHTHSISAPAGPPMVLTAAVAL